MKAWKKAIGIMIALVISTACSSCDSETIPHLYGELFQGNHISLTVKLQMNGQDVPMDQAIVTCEFEGDVQKITLNGNQYEVKGGDYGLYIFRVTVPAGTIESESEDLVFNLKYINANDWYIVGIQCEINMEPVDNGYHGDFTI